MPDNEDKKQTGPPVGKSGLVASETWEAWEPGPYNAFPSTKKKTYEFSLMSHKDATVKAALLIVRFLILSKLGGYKHDDEAIQERVDDLLDKINGGVKGVMRRLLSALWAGYAVLQPEWETGPEWYVSDCPLLHPLTFFAQNSDAEGIKLDKKLKRVTEVTQYEHSDELGASRDETVTLPIAAVMYWPLLQEAREEVYGNSMLEGARRAWFSKIKEENYWNTFAEKCACPTPVFWLPNTSITDASGDTKQITELVIEAYEGLVPGQAIGIPVDPDMAHDMDVIVPTGDGEAFERICKYWDGQLYKAILTPRLLLEEPEHASKAQASTNLELYTQILDGIREELGDVVIQQLVKPLLFYNVGELYDYGEWEFEPFDEADVELLARIYEMVERGKASAVQSGGQVLPPDDVKLRETFPDVYATPEEIEEYQEGQPVEVLPPDEGEPEEITFGEPEEAEE